MKKLILLIVLILCCGCRQITNNESNPGKDIKEITIDTPNLAQSMKDFYDLDVSTYIKGENFQVKIESITKLKVNEQRYNYLYEILIAPTKEEKVIIHGIQIKYDDEFKDIIQNNSSYFNSEFNILSALIVDTPLINEQNNYVAYKLQCVVASEYYKETFDVDEHMKKLNMNIEYNDLNEYIQIEYLDEIVMIDSLDDIDDGENDLIELFNDPINVHHNFKPYSKR